MNFPQHAKAGLALSAITAVSSILIQSDLKTAGLAGALAFIGSVLPDLDTDSIPSRWAARFGIVLCFVCLYTKIYFPATIAGLLFFAVKSAKHRGVTHKYLWSALFIGMGIYFGNFLYAAFGAGLICHYIVDSLSPLDSRNWV